MIIQPPETCEAYTKTGNHCTRKATHRHDTPGDAVHVCQMHYKMLQHRQRLGSDEEVVRSWVSRP